MGAQASDGHIGLICLAIVCVIIAVTAFSLTFFRKADTSDKAH